MKKLDLSIVIVSFNTKNITSDCIRSIKKHTKNISYEIIVVDNNSDDGSVEMLKSCGPILKLVQNDKNLGFASANNQGIKKSRGKYVLLLNSDTKLTSNSLKKAIEWMDENPQAGIMSCKLKNSDGSTQVSGGYFPTLSRVFSWMFFIDDIPLVNKLVKPFHPSSMPANPSERDWVTGAFFMMRSHMIKEVGLFDEDFFMYTEEVDYCYRAKAKNWQVWYVPKFGIIHYGGASSSSEFALLSEYKGLKTFYKKHYKNYLAALWFMLKIGALIRIPILGLTKGAGTAKIYAKAFLKN